jgi:hypothetical protein
MEKQFYSEHSGLGTDLLIHRSGVRCSPLVREEEHPVTFQYAQKIGPAKFLIASDTKCSVIENGAEDRDDPGVATSEHRSKMALCRSQQIVIAHAGTLSDVYGNASYELESYLSQEAPTSDDSRELEQCLLQWGEKRKSSVSLSGKFLIVAPTRRPHQLLKLFAPSSYRPDWYIRYSESRFVSGSERNPAVFWPEFFGVGEEPLTVDQSLAVAATTLAMAHKLEPGWIGGLEIWLYESGEWVHLDSDRCWAVWKKLKKEAIPAIQELLLGSVSVLTR